MIVFKIKDLYNSVINQNQSVGLQTLQKSLKLAKVMVKKKDEKSATIRIEKIIKWDWIRFWNFLKFWTVHNYMQNFAILI